MSSLPHIMISSTYFDLRQIRNDLEVFIRHDLGFVPLLSELSSFPVDPDADTIANCRTRVERNADILILVIGGRYGYIDPQSSKSVTNLEYLTAREKGIPIYVFMERNIIASIPIWKANPLGDFSAVVESPKVFEFVEQIRSAERVWTFPFESARDIIDTVKIQLAYLFEESLRLRLQLRGGGIPAYLMSLGPKSLRIVLERSGLWEYRLFLQSLFDQVDNRSDSIAEYKACLRIGKSEHVGVNDALLWATNRLHEVQMYVDSANNLFNVSLNDAFGPPGQPGNPEKIVWVSRMLGKVLDQTIEWGNRVRCANPDSPFENVTRELALIVDDVVEQFRTFPAVSLHRLDEALLSYHASTGPVNVDLTMRLSILNQEKLEFELLDAMRRFKEMADLQP